MRRAIEELVENGMLTRKRGVGTQVNNTEVRRRVALTSLYDDLTAEAAGAAHARLLGTGRNAPLISMRRTSFDAAGHPVEFAENLYNAERYAIEVTVHGR